MAYRVVYLGIEISCDTPEEVREIALKISEGGSTGLAKNSESQDGGTIGKSEVGTN